MKIASIEYKRLVTFGHYENQTVGAVAELEDSEDAAMALDKLKEWVIQQCQKVVVMQNVEQDIRVLEERLDSKRLEIDVMMQQAKDRWEATKAALLAHGVDVSNLEIPF